MRIASALFFGSCLLWMTVAPVCAGATGVSHPGDSGLSLAWAEERWGYVSGTFLKELAAQVSPEGLWALDAQLVAFGTRYTFRPENLDVAAWLYETLSSFGLEVRFDDHWLSGKLVRNVVATLPGSLEPESVVVLGAHYDTILHPSERNSYQDAPGADDNGTGVATVLEAARILSQYRPVRTIEFVLFSGEEQSMLGSQFYAAAKPGQSGQIVAAIIVDSLGYDPSGTNELRVDANRNSEWMLDLASQAASFTSASTIEVTEGSQFELWRLTDHEPFWYHGIPALCIKEAVNSPYWHTTEDTQDKISIPMFVEAARFSLLCTALLSFGQPDSLQLSLRTNLEHYEFGNRIELQASYENPGQAGTFLFYLALETPAEDLFFFPLWTTQPQPIEVWLPGGTRSGQVRLLSLPVPSLSPPVMTPGPYNFAGCLVATDGTLASNIAVAAFGINKIARCPQGMLRVPSGYYSDFMGDRHFVFEFCIDRYEYPNRLGDPPLHSVSWVEAWSECILQGKYLCSRDQWLRACKGPDNLRFPYGNDYSPSICNVEGTIVFPSGSFDGCVSGFGVYDMSGNVFEWTSGGQGQNLLFGGYFKSKGFGASCDYGYLPYPTGLFGKTPYAGFRCCLN